MHLDIVVVVSSAGFRYVVLFFNVQVDLRPNAQETPGGRQT